MTQNERRLWLIDALLAERPEYAGMQVPDDENDQRRVVVPPPLVDH